jgi:outer membrane protein assembly factor BamB
MSFKMRSIRLAVLVLLTLTMSLPASRSQPAVVHTTLAASSGAWTEYHRDDGHTGFDPTLPQVSSVTAGWTSAALDGEIYAEPLVYSGIVYAATLNNTVYGIDQATGLTIWSNHLGTPQASGWVCGNVGLMGILGTPVIDIAANRIYVAAEIAGATPTYRLFGLDLGTGNILLNSAIAPSGFDWKIQQERGALALANGYVYVPFGGRAGDCFDNGTPYYGWVVGVPTSGIGSPNVFQTPSGAESVWAAGGVVVDDTSHNVFFATGNAIPCAGSTLSDAIVRVSPTLTLPTFFEPNDWQANWCGPDSDLGSASPVLISPNLMFTAGKRGGGFLLDPTNLGGVDGQLYPPRTPYAQAEVCLGTHADATFGSFAYAAPFVYVECETASSGSGLVALNVNTSARSFTPCTSSCPAPDWHAGGTTRFGPPIVAAGAVWAASDGGGLTAFNATTGALIYQSAGFGVNRFVTPAEAGGQVFVPSNNVIRSFDMAFLSWTSLGGSVTSGPDAAAGAATSVDAFVRGTDNGLWQNHWNGTTWTGLTSLGGIITADPGVISNGVIRTDVFVRGSDNQLYSKHWNGTTWSPWSALGGLLTTGPDADLRAGTPGHVDVWVSGSDGQLYHKWSDDGGNTFGDWQALGGYLTSDPGSTSWSTGRVDVFVRGTDNQMYHKFWDISVGWSNWEALGGILTSAPDATSCAPGHLDVFARGSDNGLWRKGWNGSAWSAWQPLGGTWTSSPGVICRPGTNTIDLFERGPDLALWHTSVTGS